MTEILQFNSNNVAFENIVIFIERLNDDDFRDGLLVGLYKTENICIDNGKLFFHDLFYCLSSFYSFLAIWHWQF